MNVLRFPATAEELASLLLQSVEQEIMRYTRRHVPESALAYSHTPALDIYVRKGVKNAFEERMEFQAGILALCASARLEWALDWQESKLERLQPKSFQAPVGWSLVQQMPVFRPLPVLTHKIDMPPVQLNFHFQT